MRVGTCKEWGVQESLDMHKGKHLQGIGCAGVS